MLCCFLYIEIVNICLQLLKPKYLFKLMVNFELSPQYIFIKNKFKTTVSVK